MDMQLSKRFHLEGLNQWCQCPVLISTLPWMQFSAISCVMKVLYHQKVTKSYSALFVFYICVMSSGICPLLVSLAFQVKMPKSPHMFPVFLCRWRVSEDLVRLIENSCIQSSLKVLHVSKCISCLYDNLKQKCPISYNHNTGQVTSYQVIHKHWEHCYWCCWW